MKQLFKIIITMLMYWILVFIGVLVFNGADVSSEWNILILIIPAMILLLFNKSKKSNSSMLVNSHRSNTELVPINENKGRLPGAKKCREISDNMISSAGQLRMMALRANSIEAFCQAAEGVKSYLVCAAEHEDKAGYQQEQEKPSYLLRSFESMYQWKLRDAIEREEAEIMAQMNGPQHNNKRACCQGFLDEINEYGYCFSEETRQYAAEAYHRICYKAGVHVQERLCEDSTTQLMHVDNMEGKDFEYYCADLLRKNGFMDVQVTKTSGDQGIDILAEKDGIRYAIQCKCYSSDLGNKPVQEAYAGKSVYKCHVAAVLTNRYFTHGAKAAAAATGVLLWDRDKLLSFIENAA